LTDLTALGLSSFKSPLASLLVFVRGFTAHVFETLSSQMRGKGFEPKSDVLAPLRATDKLQIAIR